MYSLLLRRLLMPALLVLLFAGTAQAQIGLYDIQAIWGINFTRPKKNLPADMDFGTDYDLGATVVNIPWTKTKGSGPSSTVELHYDYTRQNFDSYQQINELKFRRHEGYARIRPLTHNPVYETVFGDGPGTSGYLLVAFLAGAYVDVGYSSVNYFVEDVWDNQLPGSDIKSGMFWGWGYNLIMRKNRFSGIVGYGSKIYTFKSVNGYDIKYSARSFQFGLAYSLVWKDK